jgi:hypothetical protein
MNTISVFAFGQSRGYAGYIRIGSMSVPNAGNSLSSVIPGISSFSSNFTGIGGELEYRAHRTILDAELMILSQGPVNSGVQYAEPFTGAAVLKTGYVIINTRNFLLYPNAGAGFGGVVVNTYQKSGDVKEQLHTIYLIEPVFDLGVSGNVIMYRFKNEAPTGILPVGVRAGYRFAFTSNDWRRANGSDLSHADYSMRGWYVSVALGMGYITGNQNKH